MPIYLQSTTDLQLSIIETNNNIAHYTFKCDLKLVK